MSESLASGTRIGHYSVIASIGSGAMGDVYRARDTKLGREVALKVLPELFAEHPERLARFQREAELLASLNHPNIAAIYGLEESDGIRALVLELVEGLTLADRIKEGPIPLDEALPIARQIAEAVEAAHEQGIIHRDLKPANIKVTPDGVVKVLDFGLAKALAPDRTPAEVADESTMTLAATRAGIILGTVAYMSPEQARGKPVERRTDVWAFGAVCYEMLAGTRPFVGASVSDTIAAILRSEPDWGKLAADTPIAIERLLRRCLAKDTKERLQHLGDARIEIRDALAAPIPVAAGAVPSGPVRAWQQPGSMVLAAVTLILLGAFGAWLLGMLGMLGGQDSSAARPLAQFGLTLPSADQLAVGGVEYSPDGEDLFYVAARNGVRQLFRRSRSQLDPVAIPDTQNAEHPFVSPNGAWFGFFADNVLKKAPMTGGPAVTLCEAGASYGASWDEDGTIVFAHSGVPGLLRVSDAGGTPATLTTPADGDPRHSYPAMLPGGAGVIFTVSGSDPQIAVLSLETAEWRTLLPGSHARYVPTGHLLFWRDGSLWAVAFDSNRLEATGDPVRMVEDVWDSDKGLAMFAFAADGTLAYAPHAQSRRHALVWVDREGRSSLLSDTFDAYKRPRISPDGQRLAVDTGGASDADIWVIEIDGGTRVRLTYDGISTNAAWRPEGDTITFARGRGAGMFSVRVDGTDEPRQLLEANLEFPFGWSSDGRTLIYDRRTPEGLMDIWHATLDDRDELARPTSFAATPADEYGPTLSPDGGWLAYVSDESRRAEVYVERFPGGGNKRAVSVNGGGEPRWSRDGRELFYRQGNAVLSVPIRYEPEFAVGEPTRLFEGAYTTDRAPDYDVSLDGRFLMIREVGDDTSTPAHLVIVQSWFEDLEARVPTGQE